jgi:hypothetical protein
MPKVQIPHWFIDYKETKLNFHLIQCQEITLWDTMSCFGIWIQCTMIKLSELAYPSPHLHMIFMVRHAKFIVILKL